MIIFYKFFKWLFFAIYIFCFKQEVVFRTSSPKVKNSNINFKTQTKFKPTEISECVPEKIFKNLDSSKTGKYYGHSIKPRKRTPKIKFQVGDVIVHRAFGYRGVIVSWDHTCQAPKFWMAAMHGENQQIAETEPHYSVLVDNRDRTGEQTTYVAQWNIVRFAHQKLEIRHRSVYDYFDFYDDKVFKYVVRDSLKGVYAEDYGLYLKSVVDKEEKNEKKRNNN